MIAKLFDFFDEANWVTALFVVLYAFAAVVIVLDIFFWRPGT